MGIDQHSTDEIGRNKWKFVKRTLLNRLWKNNTEELPMRLFLSLKGQTITFSLGGMGGGGGYRDFQEAGNFFPPSIESLQFFSSTHCANNYFKNSPNFP